MIENDLIEVLRRKFTRLTSELDERGRRRWAASEALELGHGGIKAGAQATGLGGRTSWRGCQELGQEPGRARPGNPGIRRGGGGGKTSPSPEPGRGSSVGRVG